MIFDNNEESVERSSADIYAESKARIEEAEENKADENEDNESEQDGKSTEDESKKTDESVKKDETENKDELENKDTKKTEEGKKEEPEKSKAKKIENAVATVAKKLKESKEEATKAQQVADEAEKKLNAFKAKMAKKAGVSLEEFEKTLEDDGDSTLSDADKAKMIATETQLAKTKSELNEIKLTKGIEALVELGGTEETILSFLNSSAEKHGIDLKENPDINKMIGLWKTENVDNIIAAKVQEQLKAKKSTVTITPPGKKVNNDKKKDPFREKMIKYAKGEF